MAKPTGFMEYSRETVQNVPCEKRIENFEEFIIELDSKKRQTQAARCMDCGTPFCHSGILISQMASGCPISNIIPEWNELIYRGLWKEAFYRLRKTNNFPEFTGRVCPAPCEGSCTLGMNEPSVTIKNNELHLASLAYSEGWIKSNPPKNRTGKKVAIVGSGPSGLACAEELNRMGHNVTVFERADRPGGLLMYGIPNMKLAKSLVLKRIDIMKEDGVKFLTCVDIGKDFESKKLLEEFDATVLCIGSTRPRDLKVEGRELLGIDFAMNFLGKNTKSYLDSNLNDANFINAKDRNVVVIGGGDTGTDCVATSLRHGAKSIVQFEILPQPPLERTATNPWPEWSKTLKTDYGQEEAKAQFGSDPRQFCILTKKFVGDENGALKEIHTINVEWKKLESGQIAPCEIPGTEKIWPAELALISMGFLGPEETIMNTLAIEMDSSSTIKTFKDSYATSVKGVFAAGDGRRGQSLVVWAIKEGREAAAECNSYLNCLV